MPLSPEFAFHYIVEVIRDEQAKAQLICVLPSFRMGLDLCERRMRGPLAFVEQWPGEWQAQGTGVVYQIRVLVASHFRSDEGEAVSLKPTFWALDELL